MPTNITTTTFDALTLTEVSVAYEQLYRYMTAATASTYFSATPVATNNFYYTITNNMYMPSITSGIQQLTVPFTNLSAWIKPDPILAARAKRKARKLLKDNISAEQWKMFQQHEWIEVVAESGAVYRIRNGRSRNVTKIEEGQAVEILCAHPSMQCPNEDTMLAQKFLLECDEEGFRKTANIEKLYVPKKKVILPEQHQTVMEALRRMEVAA